MFRITRILFLLVALMAFSCGEEMPNTDYVDSNETAQNPKKEIQDHNEEPDKQKEATSFLDRVDLKVAKFIEGKSPHSDVKNIPQDFIDFYTRFIADSTYQVKHIDFENIVGADLNCDTIIEINPSNWMYTNWSLLDSFDKEKRSDPRDGWDNRYYFDEKSVYCQFELTEVGMISRLGFEKVNGVWKLTLYAAYNC